jgi:hypothetical protein
MNKEYDIQDLIKRFCFQYNCTFNTTVRINKKTYFKFINKRSEEYLMTEKRLIKEYKASLRHHSLINSEALLDDDDAI